MGVWIIIFVIILHIDGSAIDRKEDCRSDIAPIESRIKNISKIAHVKWKWERLTTDSLFSPPGPSVFRIWGYVQFEKGELSETIKNHSFSDLKQISLSVDFPYCKDDEKYIWETSESFTKMITNPTNSACNLYLHR